MIKIVKSQRGQTLIEFAFIMVLLLIIIMGIVEFSIVMYNKAMITKAGREGAREGVLFRVNYGGDYGYLPWDSSQIETAVNGFLQDNLFTFGGSTNAVITSEWFDGVNWNAAPPTGPTARNNEELIRVTVSFPYTFLVLPRLAGLGDTLTLASTTTMRME